MSRTVEPTQAHQDAKKAVEDAIRPHTEALGAEGMLAVLSQVVGMIFALQDQSKHTPDAVMNMVLHNIEVGNMAMIHQVLGEAVEGETEQ